MCALIARHVVLVYVVLAIESVLSASISDTFICKKAADIYETDGDAKWVYIGIAANAGKRIETLERRVKEMEWAAKSRVTSESLPSVIKLFGDAFPKDCVDILQAGETADGIYTVSPDGRCPFDVYCDMTNGGWTVLQRRRGGNVNFRRNWRHYVDGFGDFDDEFWLGLENIHRLTNGGSQIYIGLESHGGRLDYAQYDSFVVHDVTSAYRMNVDPHGYNGSIPNLLSYHDDFKFSTYDRDNDAHSNNCCERYGGGGGWWYNSCYRLGLLNAVYGKKAEGGISYWNNAAVYVKNTIIKIKPRKGMC